jgi:hypothetical protein
MLVLFILDDFSIFKQLQNTVFVFEMECEISFWSVLLQLCNIIEVMQQNIVKRVKRPYPSYVNVCSDWKILFAKRILSDKLVTGQELA